MKIFCKLRKVEKNLGNCRVDGEMQRNAAALTVVCIMMCLTVNYTFPLHRSHRSTTDAVSARYPNQTTETEECNIPTHRATIVERSKKMATNLENAIKRIKDSTQDISKNIYDHVSNGLKGHINILTDEDLRQYEQMVIMKKYPYLDLKELEQKYTPTKNTRQSAKFAHNGNTANDPGIWEPVDESPNVEITSRGLTGFAIPPELTRHESVAEVKAKLNTNGKEEFSKLSKKSLLKEVSILKSDIEEYVEKKRNKPI